MTLGSRRALWSAHDQRWRSPAAVVTQWADADEVDPQLLQHRVRGAWWETLARLRITLLVSREYEHLLMALTVDDKGRPRLSYLPVPHPSGIAIDRSRHVVHLASTRNPNQVFTLRPANSVPDEDAVLMPASSSFLPGQLYLHDIAFIHGELYGAAAGINAIVRLDRDRDSQAVWWPRCIDGRNGPAMERNYLQLNSIAAGHDVRSSFFSASSDRISTRRPGHRNFAVDGRGVIFSGASREPIAGGLTRPHSARLHGRSLWVNNSGYGEVGRIEAGRFSPVTRLAGWTRGLAFCHDVAFIGTSRVLPRFRHYAPGLEVDRSICGLHALDARTGEVLGSLVWPAANQIFGIEWMPASAAAGLPLTQPRRSGRRELQRFYAFSFAASQRLRRAA